MSSSVLQTNFIVEANTMNPDQTAPEGSSLIWIHIVCTIGFQSDYTDERADDNFHEWRGKGQIFFYPQHFTCQIKSTTGKTKAKFHFSMQINHDISCEILFAIYV